MCDYVGFVWHSNQIKQESSLWLGRCMWWVRATRACKPFQTHSKCVFIHHHSHLCIRNSCGHHLSWNASFSVTRNYVYCWKQFSIHCLVHMNESCNGTMSVCVVLREWWLIFHATIRTTNSNCFINVNNLIENSGASVILFYCMHFSYKHMTINELNRTTVLVSHVYGWSKKRSLTSMLYSFFASFVCTHTSLIV